jgi:phage FluMu protein Com
MKIIVQCRHCGAIILKTEEAIIGLLHITSKCPNQNCPKKGLLLWPNDIQTKEEVLPFDTKSRPGVKYN